MDFSFLDDTGHAIESTLLTITASALAAGGGIGGGGILVPTFVLILGFDAHHAIPLSKTVIAGGAVYNFLYNRPKRHTIIKGRTLIDYSLALLMEPLTMAGTIVGVFLNVLLPGYVISIMLMALLIRLTIDMGAKSVKMYRQEEQKRELGRGSMQISRSSLSRSLLKENQENPRNKDPIDYGEAWENVPWRKVGMLGCSWLVIFLFSMLKDDSWNVVTCGSTSYWLLTFAPIPILGVITYLAGVVTIREKKTKDADYYTAGDIPWDGKNVLQYPALCSLAGVAAALLGIGGGLVKTPLFLRWGVRPDVVRVTSAFMILFTSTAVSMQYLILGKLEAGEVLWFASWGFVGSGIGNLGVGYLMKKYNRQSILLVILTVAVAVSAVAMGIESTIDLLDTGFVKPSIDFC